MKKDERRTDKPYKVGREVHENKRKVTRAEKRGREKKVRL
jgi:hypothetical protein